MPFIKSLVSKYYVYIVAVILLLSKIMLIYFCYVEKKLVYITIAAPFSCQPSFYSKYIKLNIYLSYNIKLVFNIKYIFISFYNIYNLSQLLSGNT